MPDQKHRPKDAFLAFAWRFLLSLGYSGLFILAALLVGMAGYHWIAQLSWVDAFLNASMILGGIGPVDALHTTSAKVFASVYALFSGLVFVLAMGTVLAPMVQAVLGGLKLEKDAGT